MPDPRVLRVGAPYLAGRTSWPDGTSLFSVSPSGYELVCCLAAPTAREVRQYRARTPCRFALAVHGPVLFLLYRFGDLPWSDSPYSVHLLPAGRRRVPDTADLADPHALLMVVLVDAATGLVRQIRAVTFSPAFTAALHLAIRDQLASPWPGPAAYDAALAALYRRYPTSEALLETAVARTEGGS
jgi:hypothetical protein